MNAYDLIKIAEKNGGGKYTPIQIVDSEGRIKDIKLEDVEYQYSPWSGASININVNPK